MATGKCETGARSYLFITLKRHYEYGIFFGAGLQHINGVYGRIIPGPLPPGTAAGTLAVPTVDPTQAPVDTWVFQPTSLWIINVPDAPFRTFWFEHQLLETPSLAFPEDERQADLSSQMRTVNEQLGIRERVIRRTRASMHPVRGIGITTQGNDVSTPTQRNTARMLYPPRD